jgi:tetratricopeptide (TPR) repeat protein
MAQRRKELHRLVGVGIETLYADRLGERYDVLAHHFAKAEEWPQALAYLLKAADKASQASAIREALALYDQALGDERSAEVGRRRNGPGTLPNAELNLGDNFMAKGDLARAHDRLEFVHHLARDPPQGEWMKWRYSIRLFASLGELWLARGDSAMALGYADQCLELATRTGARKNLVKGWRLKAETALGRHQLDDAERALREALVVAQAIGNPTQLWKTHVAVGRLHEEKRNVESARQAYQAARDVIDGVHANLRSPALRASFERSPAIRAVYDPGTPR